MITIKKSVSPEEIRQKLKHTLFVEGSDYNAIDPIVLSNLLSGIRVEPLGPSHHIRGAAEALYKYHPYYYFLIDRDHYDDQYVERCWSDFPNPAKLNLLIWRRREIENYFLIPEYIIKSEFKSVSNDQAYTVIIQCCKERLYIDTANQVIISVREELKKKWIELFTNPQEFKSKRYAIEKLTKAKEFPNHKGKVSKIVDRKEIINKFEKTLADMTGGKDHIEYGRGKWIEMIRGKKVLPHLINHCFRVKDANDTILQGKEKLMEVVKELLSKPLSEQPDDFQKLHELIVKRIESS